MSNICLTFGTNAATTNILNALTTLSGLSSWWTSTTTGDTSQGGTIVFRFGEHGGCDMRVVKSTANQVHWECTQGADDWIGTRIEFEIQEKGTHNQLMFRHAGWSSENSFFHHCSTKWATFLFSLRDYLETGKGKPYPHDVKIEARGM